MDPNHWTGLRRFYGGIQWLVHSPRLCPQISPDLPRLRFLALGPVPGVIPLPVKVSNSKQKRGTFFVLGTAWGVAVYGSYAYVADSSAGLLVIDVSMPSAPIEIGSYNSVGTAQGVAVSRGHVYVTERELGLEIFSPLGCFGYGPVRPAPRRVSGRRTP